MKSLVSFITFEDKGGRIKMKLKVAASTQRKINGYLATKVILEIPQGVYRAEFSGRKVDFYKMAALENFVTGDFMEFEFSEENLRKKEEMENVFYYPCVIWNLPEQEEQHKIVRQKLVIEYLKGEIDLRNPDYQPGELGVYFPLTTPFEAVFDRYDYSHGKVSETLAIRLCRSVA